MAYGVFPSGGIGAMMDVLRGTRWSGWVPPEASVSLRKYLLVPQLIFYATRAPRDQHLAWERYWSRVRRTGATGEVLWDTGEQSELDAAARQLQLHADLALPLVDLGCGNGRQAGALTRYAPRVVGIGLVAGRRRQGSCRGGLCPHPRGRGTWSSGSPTRPRRTSVSACTPNSAT